MKNLLLCLFCLGFLSGCAAFGTTTKFSDPSNSLAAITRVGLITSSVSLPLGVVAREVDSVFVKDLSMQLAAATGWQVQYLGEAEAFIATMGNANNSALNGTDYQAIVHAELALAYYGMSGNLPRFNSSTRMQIIHFPSKKLLGESHFNTLMGNSYMAHPVIRVAITDGITGMINPWKKRLTHIRARR